MDGGTIGLDGSRCGEIAVSGWYRPAGLLVGFDAAAVRVLQGAGVHT